MNFFLQRILIKKYFLGEGGKEDARVNDFLSFFWGGGGGGGD